MLSTLFVVLIVVGAACWFLATFPGWPYWERVARGCWFVAALVWALGAVR